MRIERVVAFECRAGDCPTTYDLDTGEVLVQGYVVDDPQALGVDLPTGEVLVRVPRSLLAQHARKAGLA